MAASVGRKGTRWLLLQLRLPPGRSTARVDLWRRLRRLGALGLGATWALPAGEESRESLEWLRRDAEAAGGEALLFEAEPLGVTAEELTRRRRGEPARRPRGRAALAPLDRASYRGRVWVTRPRPGVDRMATAWLVRRFVDPQARFEFSSEPERHRRRAVPFDSYGAELGHREGLCTFEVAARRFGIDEPGVAALGRLVRAIDLHAEADDPAAAATVERLVEGLRATHADDAALLEAGISLFAALHAAGGTGGKPARRAAAGPRRRR